MSPRGPSRHATAFGSGRGWAPTGRQRAVQVAIDTNAGPASVDVFYSTLFGQVLAVDRPRSARRHSRGNSRRHTGMVNCQPKHAKRDGSAESLPFRAPPVPRTLG